MALRIRKLSAEETAETFPKRGQMDLTDYREALRDVRPGEAGEVELAGLSTRALKRRLGQAAKQLGYTLKWARESGGDKLRFMVREGDQPSTARNGRRGRRKKSGE